MFSIPCTLKGHKELASPLTTRLDQIHPGETESPTSNASEVCLTHSSGFPPIYFTGLQYILFVLLQCENVLHNGLQRALSLPLACISFRASPHPCNALFSESGTTISDSEALSSSEGCDAELTGSMTSRRSNGKKARMQQHKYHLVLCISPSVSVSRKTMPSTQCGTKRRCVKTGNSRKSVLTADDACLPTAAKNCVLTQSIAVQLRRPAPARMLSSQIACVSHSVSRDSSVSY